MTTTNRFIAQRILLGDDVLASETTSPNAGGGTPATTGSLWLRAGNGINTPTQVFLDVTGIPTGWTIENLTLGVFNVKRFGAVGDGVTDDTAAINLATSTASSAGGGIVYFPPGTYRVTKPPGVNASIRLSNAHDLVFLGDGEASRISMIGDAGGASWHLFFITGGSSGIKILNLAMNAVISNPSPTKSNHLISVASMTGDPLGAPHDVDVVGVYVGDTVGDGLHVAGAVGEVTSNVRCLLGDFGMTSSRSCVNARQLTEQVNASFNFLTGAATQQIQFDPSAGEAGPISWTIVGNHVDASTSTSPDAITISGSSDLSTEVDDLLIFALNTITHGGSISSHQGLSRAAIVGNIITLDQAASATAPLFFTGRTQDIAISGNLCVNQTALNNIGISIASTVADGGIATRICVTDNAVVARGSNFQGIALNDCSESVASGNLVQLINTGVSLPSGISAFTATEVVDHVCAHGNMIIAVGARAKMGINFSDSNFDRGNSAANWNYVRNAAAIAQFDRPDSHQFFGWRSVIGNNGIAITNASISLPTLFPGVTLEGSAGPGDQITLIQDANGPEGEVPAPIGSLGVNVSGGQGTTLWMKVFGTGASGGSTGWVQHGAAEIDFGAQSAGTGSGTLFLAPGMGLVTAGATEIKMTATRPGAIRNMRFTGTAGVGAATVTYRLRVNGVITAVLVSVANTAIVATGTGTVTVATGDKLSVQVTKTAVVATAQSNVCVSFEVTA